MNSNQVVSESLKDQAAVVTGGSRGLGLGVVEALVENGARVAVVARGSDDLEAVHKRLDVGTIAGDIGEADFARRVLRDIEPSILVLNAGARPSMAPLDKQTWEDFSVAWETDVKAGLYWIQAALAQPLPQGTRVLVGSSGAAANGSRLSGGYAGAKRMLWFMASYANDISAERGLGIRFQAIVPMQIIGGTGVGDTAADAYRRASGMTAEQFLATRFGAPLAPRRFGDHLVSILTDPAYASGLAFGLHGASGITILEEAQG